MKFTASSSVAVMKYTEPFYAKDMDIWVEPTAEKR
jgi:hypothetical protein